MRGVVALGRCDFSARISEKRFAVSATQSDYFPHVLRDFRHPRLAGAYARAHHSRARPRRRGDKRSGRRRSASRHDAKPLSPISKPLAKTTAPEFEPVYDELIHLQRHRLSRLEGKGAVDRRRAIPEHYDRYIELAREASRPPARHDPQSSQPKSNQRRNPPQARVRTRSSRCQVFNLLAYLRPRLNLARRSRAESHWLSSILIPPRARYTLSPMNRILLIALVLLLSAPSGAAQKPVAKNQAVPADRLGLTCAQILQIHFRRLDQKIYCRKGRHFAGYNSSHHRLRPVL